MVVRSGGQGEGSQAGAGALNLPLPPLGCILPACPGAWQKGKGGVRLKSCQQQTSKKWSQVLPYSAHACLLLLCKYVGVGSLVCMVRACLTCEVQPDCFRSGCAILRPHQPESQLPHVLASICYFLFFPLKLYLY